MADADNSKPIDISVDSRQATSEGSIELASQAAFDQRDQRVETQYNIAGLGQLIVNLITGTTEQQRDLRNRQKMLKQVHDFWVKGVLENSLYNKVLIELRMEEKCEAVEYPWGMVIQRPDQPNRQLPPGTKIIDAFDESCGSLLILGEPGSGKTTMLLELARQLIARLETELDELFHAEHKLVQPTQPMPVVFNLSSWAEKRLPLIEWLEEELYSKYSISKTLAQKWISTGDLLPLLDGLDEVVVRHRDACVVAINQFCQDQAPMLVICCRLSDYEALPTQLRVQHCVLLQPLIPEQVEDYLNRVEAEPSALQTAIRNDARLQELARSPLMLNIMTLVFQQMYGDDFQAFIPTQTYKERLFEAYVQQMFKRRGYDARYLPEYTIRWLSWLARKMKEHGQTAFYIEQMQASWLSTRQQQRLYEVSLRLIGGTAFLVMGALCALLSVGWFLAIQSTSQAFPLMQVLTVGLGAGLAFVLSSMVAVRWWIVPLVILTTGVALALMRLQDPMIGFIGGILFGLPGAIAGLPMAQHRDIQISDAFNWSWREVGKGVLLGVVVGLAAGILSPNDKLINGLQIGLPIGLILSLILGLGRVEHINTRTKPNQGLHRSIQHAFRIGLGASLLVLLFGILVGIIQNNLVTGMAFGVLMAGIIGLAAALYAGGNDGLQHGTLRFMLYRNREIPWHLVDFLDYAVDRIFLRKIGHGYIFVHQWLQEHLLSQDTKECF